MNRFILSLAVVVLAAGPWLGLGPPTDPVVPARSSMRPSAIAPLGLSQVAPEPATSRRSSRPARCTCRDVVVNASNEVRDSEITTGDAEARNRSLTYVGPGFDGKRIKVSQRARAETGDAIAGQILGVVAPDPCANLTIRADNLVEDSVVETGDALASNESLVLYDPASSLGDSKIKVRQKARARSGHAIAGQIIGAAGGGGGCGGVTVEATNEVNRTRIASGDAIARNLSEILACDSDDCVDRLLRYLRSLDEVQLCKEGGCDYVSPEEFIAWLGLSPSKSKDGERSPASTPTPQPRECAADGNGEGGSQNSTPTPGGDKEEAEKTEDKESLVPAKASSPVEDEKTDAAPVPCPAPDEEPAGKASSEKDTDPTPEPEKSSTPKP